MPQQEDVPLLILKPRLYIKCREKSGACSSLTKRVLNSGMDTTAINVPRLKPIKSATADCPSLTTAARRMSLLSMPCFPCLLPFAGAADLVLFARGSKERNQTVIKKAYAGGFGGMAKQQALPDLLSYREP